MNLSAFARLILAVSLLGTGLSAQAAAESVATVKSTQGEIHVERGGQNLPLTVGTGLLQSDTVVTGSGGAAGITFADNTLVSLGADSRFVIDSFRFDRESQRGEFQSTLAKGRMAVVSGKIAKSQLDAMKVRTPTSLLGVRGTEFVVEAGQ